MADDRSVFPGDAEPPAGRAVGRSTGRWLNRETAERLLTGEAADNAVAPAHRDEADRLARTLDALAAMSAAPVPEDEELPGEAAALAAFRKLRADRAPDPASDFSHGEALSHEKSRSPGRPLPHGHSCSAGQACPHGPAPAPAEDGGVVRIGGRARPHGRRRPRWNRPARLGLATALTVSMVGGVAVAAGTGFLPTPFDDAAPGPAASVSAAATPAPDKPLVPTTPGAGAGSAAPGGGTKGTPAPGTDGSGGPAPRADDLVASCREKKAGRALDAERRGTLERAAGGSARVPAYCTGLLDDRDSGDRDSGGRKSGGENSGGPTGGKKEHDHRDQRNGAGNGGRNGGGNGGGSAGRAGGKTGGTTGQDGKGRGGGKDDKGDKGGKGPEGGKGGRAGAGDKNTKNTGNTGNSE
ncbi:hypothetical protein ACFYO5_18330 [Streptomyces sp. NPDC006259]|uniref:hypothetical protein n=1 Tax=Streptomyces sp. NPDC006259 TaxID=3364740 RepID=UPI0036A4D9FD